MRKATSIIWCILVIVILSVFVLECYDTNHYDNGQFVSGDWTGTIYESLECSTVYSCWFAIASSVVFGYVLIISSWFWFYGAE